MVGASDTVFARIKPVLDTWAGKVVHIGAIGDGHKMKLLNNFISLGYAAIYAEALVLGAKVGISPQRFHSVIDGGRMDCGFYQTFMGCVSAAIANRHRFTIANAFKDLKYLESMADAAVLLNPVGNAVKNSFAAAVAAGGGGARTMSRTCPSTSAGQRPGLRRRGRDGQAQGVAATPASSGGRAGRVRRGSASGRPARRRGRRSRGRRSRGGGA